ncbi:hypothetical protein GLAREA_11875 [Glarea lozoyensis ATCC 20868]|uniref:Uncharacterized protein n=1 Tax=Glarea lozoyensis (strain ATCC 20868 / MF5171) TaxID=1116229 RepID=S3DZS8_GLAL2|nr:uncharacterized protein GLAREA_11875 [Glarea lozoyensis ATCC 20868]EPE31793.1 hypothetical protein GLAREA_11875 [Glarea lozoyensis ATCC 20868]
MAHFINATSSTFRSQANFNFNSMLQSRWLELFTHLATTTWTDIQTTLFWNLSMVAASVLLSSAIAFVFASSLEGRGDIYRPKKSVYYFAPRVEDE